MCGLEVLLTPHSLLEIHVWAGNPPDSTPSFRIYPPLLMQCVSCKSSGLHTIIQYVSCNVSRMHTIPAFTFPVSTQTLRKLTHFLNLSVPMYQELQFSSWLTFIITAQSACFKRTWIVNCTAILWDVINLLNRGATECFFFKCPSPIAQTSQIQSSNAMSRDNTIHHQASMATYKQAR